MSSISINTLSQRLEKRFKVMGVKAAREHAKKLASKLSDTAKRWQDGIYKILSKPDVRRGYYGHSKLWLNPHNNYGYNRGFPMMHKGLLRQSIYQRVYCTNSRDGATITISRGFNELNSGAVKQHSDYGEFLDKEHSVLGGWKQRAYDKLDKHIRSLVRIRDV